MKISDVKDNYTNYDIENKKLIVIVIMREKKMIKCFPISL